MAPSINLYNSIVIKDAAFSQDIIQKMAPNVHLDADFQKYNQLIGILFSVVRNFTIDDFYIGINHHEIIKAINEVWKVKKQFDIWNIDHHHDCGYLPLENIKSSDDILNDPLNCGNWVPHLKKINPNFSSYIWIGNPNSENVISEHCRDFLGSYFLTSDITMIDFHEFDKVFICTSPGWIPRYYDGIINGLIFSLEQYIKK